MNDEIELLVGETRWALRLPADRRVELRRAAIVPPAGTAAELAREALEHPLGFEAMRRALTPDDHVVVVLDPTVPEVGAILAEVLLHLRSGGIALEAVTVLTPPEAPQYWLDELPDEFADVRTEIHDPTDRQKLAYLATTSSGRRLYLNRTLVDADFVVVLSGRGFDPQSGYSGAESAVFPSLSDEETRSAFAGELHVRAPGEALWPARAEAAEAIYLLGMPFLVQVIEGDGIAVQEIVAGLPPTSAEGIRRQDSRWRGTVTEAPDTVVVAPARAATFLDLAKAAACGARVVRKGGRIAILTQSAPDLGDGARLLRSMDGPTGAKKLLAREKPADWAASLLWAYAAKNHSLYLASGLPDEIAEELFTTPIHSASEVQRLIDGSERVLVIPDANRMMVTLDES